MKTIEIQSKVEVTKGSMQRIHQVAFKREFEPSIRVCFIVKGIVSIEEARKLMLTEAKKYMTDNNFDKFRVVF